MEGLGFPPALLGSATTVPSLCLYGANGFLLLLAPELPHPVHAFESRLLRPAHHSLLFECASVFWLDPSCSSLPLGSQLLILLFPNVETVCL